MGFPFFSATSILTESLPYRPLHREQEFTGPRQENPASSQAEWKSIHGSVGSGSCHFGYGFRGLSPSFTSNTVGPCLQFQHYANRAPQNPTVIQSSGTLGKELGERKVHTRTLVLPPQSSPLSPGPFYCKDRSGSAFFWREMEKEPGNSRPSLWAKHSICILLFDLHLEGA